ncbi:MAG: hemerythrin domain-containing protein [Candidatus Omnitrophica bacterium]|nr:hemerythrin domain-containing protein [Candidatus Omnitrophota bacterium]
MKAIEQLKEEHDNIKLMLNILNKIYDKLQYKRELNQEHFSKILEFLEVFVEKCHHGKEENFLLPVMLEIGVPQDKGPIAFILMEHKGLRRYFKDFSVAFTRLQNGDSKASEQIAENLKKYIMLLSQHIEKENNIFFPLVDKLLTESKQKDLAEDFEIFEMEYISTEKHEEFCMLPHHLSEIYV